MKALIVTIVVFLLCSLVVRSQSLSSKGRKFGANSATEDPFFGFDDDDNDISSEFDDVSEEEADPFGFGGDDDFFSFDDDGFGSGA